MKLLFLVLAGIIVLSSGVSSTPGCPKGIGRRRGNKCYVWVNRRMNWQSARNYCKRMKGDLASMHSMGDDMFLASLVSPGEPKSVFVGGKATCHSCTSYRWVDGSPMNFQHWAPRQPDHTGQDCITFHTEWYKQNREWWDNDFCYPSYTFICQASYKKPAPPAPKPKPKPKKPVVKPTENKPYKPKRVTKCEAGFTMKGKRCYYVSQVAMTWSDASDKCANIDGWLVSVPNAAEGSKVAGMLGGATGWVGGYRLAGVASNRNFKWTDNSNAAHLGSDFASGYPKGKYNDCVAVNSAGQFVNADCDVGKKKFVCYSNPYSYTE